MCWKSAPLLNSLMLWTERAPWGRHCTIWFPYLFVYPFEKKRDWSMFYNVWQLKALLLDSQRETFKKTKWSRSAKPVSQTTGLYTWKVRRVLYESLMQFCIEKSFLWFACGFACILVFLLMLLFYWGFSIIFLTKVLLVYVLL